MLALILIPARAQMLDELGYTFHDETENTIFQKFMR